MDHLTIYRAPTPARHPRIIVLSEKQTKKLKLEIVLSEKQTKGLKVEEFCCNPFVRLFVPQWHQNGVKKNQACWARSPVGVDKETNKMRKNSIISILQGELWPFCTQWTFFSKSHWQQIKFWQWLFQDGVHIFQSMMYISSSCGIALCNKGWHFWKGGFVTDKTGLKIFVFINAMIFAFTTFVKNTPLYGKIASIVWKIYFQYISPHFLDAAGGQISDLWLLLLSNSSLFSALMSHLPLLLLHSALFVFST